MHLQVVFFDDQPRPHDVQQLLFGDQTFTPFAQRQQKVKSAPTQPGRLAIHPQLPGVGVDVHTVAFKLLPTQPARPAQAWRWPHCIGVQLAGEVLDRVLAQVFKNRRHALAQHGLHGMRHRERTRAGQAFQPRGDVDAVTVHRAVGLFDHVADMDTNAELQPAVCRGTVFSQYLLHGQRGLHSRHGTVKHRQHRVTGHVDDTAIERRNLLPKNCAGSVQRRHRGAIVHGHQA